MKMIDEHILLLPLYHSSFELKFNSLNLLLFSDSEAAENRRKKNGEKDSIQLYNDYLLA